MLILALRTDKPEAEIGLYDGRHKISEEVWLAHRELSMTLHEKIESLLSKNQKQWSDIDAIVGYQGPGSFTGLRISLSVANALAFSLGVPVVGSTGDDWVATGIVRLQNGEHQHTVLPEYGSPVHITQQRK